MARSKGLVAVPEVKQPRAKGFEPRALRRSLPPSKTAASHEVFATFLAELSARFVSVRIESVDDEISGALRGIVERLDVDRCSLGRISASGEFALLSSYSPPGMPPLPPDACAKLPWYA